MAAILGGERTGRNSITQQTMRHLLDSIATRFDEARDISRYMTRLLVFLGLVGTFWGLIETGRLGRNVIHDLKVGGDTGAVFDSLCEGLARPFSGMGISFSSSLFGLGGLADRWASSTCRRTGAEPLLHGVGGFPGSPPSSASWRGDAGRALGGAIDKLNEAIAESGSNRARPRQWPTLPKRSTDWSRIWRNRAA